MQKYQRHMSVLMLILGAVISSPATLQAQEQTNLTSQTVEVVTDPQVDQGIIPAVTMEVELDPPAPQPPTERLGGVRIVSEEEVECLARNIYFESRGESRLGKVAVAFVTKNRAESTQWPSTICGVVYQRHKRVCQFSWTCDAHPNTIKQAGVWSQALDIARDVLTSVITSDPTNRAVFFHNNKVVPKWSRSSKMSRTTKIGSHTFYRLP